MSIQNQSITHSCECNINNTEISKIYSDSHFKNWQRKLHYQGMLYLGTFLSNPPSLYGMIIKSVLKSSRNLQLFIHVWTSPFYLSFHN